MDDFQAARGYHDAFAHLRFAAGDYEGDARGTRRSCSRPRDVRVRRHPGGAGVALAARRRRHPRRLLGAAATSPWGARPTSGSPRIRAGLAALEGRPTTRGPAYLAAEAGLRDLGIRFELGLALPRARGLPAGRPVGRARRPEEARAIFADLGATTLLARLPAAVSSATLAD